MQLSHLYLKNFKSYPEAELDFCARINCLTGNNGSGKTNLLDAIYHLSFSKSYFGIPDRENIRHGEDYFSLNGQYEFEGNPVQVSLVQKKGRRKSLKYNQKEYNRLSDHIGRIPLVMASPQDLELLYGGSESRRKFIDGVIAQFNPPYLEHLLAYNKALEQRNRLLKDEDIDLALLEAFDFQMQLHGTAIFQERNRFVQSFLPVFQRYYERIAGSGEKAGLGYQSQLHQQDFPQLLKNSAQKDRLLQFSSAGVHRDDLELLLDGYPIRRCGSQGQQKSFLLALRLSQLQYTAEMKKNYPILLLDDIFDKLDKERVERLMEVVGEAPFGQVFLSDTHQSRVKELFGKSPAEHLIYRIEDSCPRLME